MKNVFAGLCTVLAAACMGASAAEPTSATVNVTWNVSIGIDGRVTAISTDNQTVPKLHARLEKAIRSWQFTPGSINGKPAPTQTYLNTKLDVRIVNDAAEIRLLGARTGGTYGKQIAPAYPHTAAQNGKQGLAMLRVAYDASGVVKRVAPYGDNSHTDRRLVDAAISAAKKWTFLPEIVDGHPIAGEAGVPVCFHLDTLTQPDCNWQDPATGSSTDGTQSVAFNPAATLNGDMVGRLL